MVFLYVYGEDYSALDFRENNNPQEVYESMVREKELTKNIDGACVEIIEFEDVDPEFIDFVIDNLCDYDQLKSANIFEVIK